MGPPVTAVKEFGKNTLSESRRLKLEALRKRENDKAKAARRAQLEASVKQPRSTTRHLSSSKSDCRLVPESSESLKGSAALNPAQPSMSSTSTISSSSSSSSSLRGKGSGEHATQKLKVLEEAANTLASDWSLLDAYNIVEYQRSEKVKLEKKQAERDRMKKELHAQLARKEESVRLKALNDRKQVEDIRKQNEAWAKEARDIKAERMATLNREIAAREAMAKSRIDETRRRKAIKDQQDLRELEKVRAEIAEEELKRKDRVVQERKRLEAIMAENVKEKAIREKAKHDQWEADKRQMIEHQQRMDRIAAEREAKKIQKKAVLDAKALHFETSDQARESAEREAAEKAYINRELAKQAKAVEDRHFADREKIRREKELIKRDNDALIAHKAMLRAKVRGRNVGEKIYTLIVEVLWLSGWL